MTSAPNKADSALENADIVNRTQTQLPDDAAQALRSRLGLAAGAPLRISYVPGPGDVAGTYTHWGAGRHDPRVPVFTYSAMYYELLEKLDAQGLLVTRHPGTEPLPSDGEPQGGRVRFQRHLKGPKSGFLGYWRRELRYGRELLAHLNQFQPHVVIVSTDVPWFFWPQLGRNRVCLLSAHNTFWKMGDRPGAGAEGVKLALMARAMRHLSGAVCTSQECARQVTALSGDTLPNWTEIPQQKRRFAIARDRKTARRLCFIGRIVPAKGMKMLLEAFSKVAASRPDMSLVFAGSGTGEEALRAEIAALQDPRITFPGRLPSAEIHALLDQSDLLICPTRSDFAEGLGLVVAEAAAHGVPSIVSSMVPARELFSAACSVFPADDTAALTNLLEQVISDEATYEKLCQGTAENQDKMLDRNHSWGSQIYRAMLGSRS